MKRKSKNLPNNNLKLVVFFIVFILFLIAGSLFLKGLTLVKKSRFDGIHRFTVLLISPKNEKELISFSPDNNSIYALNVLGKEGIEQIMNTLSVPIDGKILIKKPLDIYNYFSSNEGKDMKGGLSKITLSYNNLETNLTIVDLLRLYVFAFSLPAHSISVEDISLKDIDTSKQIIIDSITSQSFIDNAVIKEKLSIQIVNGTGVSGLGNKLAKIISNMGGNVVLVSTANSILSSSAIAYRGPQTYTVRRLSSLLDLKIKDQSDLTVSDIVIILGKDQNKLLGLKRWYL